MSPPIILVVDDEPLVRRTVERALKRAKYDVHIASGGTEALAMVDAGLVPDLVVSDVMMDDMDSSLREMGVGDLGVGRRVKAMAQAFYGRATAYEAALAADDEALDQARAMLAEGAEV